MAKRMTEQIAEAEKSVSEQIENARIRAAQIAADAKETAKSSCEDILTDAHARAAQIIKAATDDAETQKQEAALKAKEQEATYIGKYEANKMAAIKKAEEILLS